MEHQTPGQDPSSAPTPAPHRTADVPSRPAGADQATEAPSTRWAAGANETDTASAGAGPAQPLPASAKPDSGVTRPGDRSAATPPPDTADVTRSERTDGASTSAAETSGADAAATTMERPAAQVPAATWCATPLAPRPHPSAQPRSRTQNQKTQAPRAQPQQAQQPATARRAAAWGETMAEGTPGGSDSPRVSPGSAPASAGGVQRAGVKGRQPTRFTAIGIGLVTCGISIVGGLVDAFVLDGPGALFGVVFVAACVVAAARVRAADLAAAPISAPIAFALALLVNAPSSGRGLSGHVLAVATGLAMHAGWLFTGTLLAAGLVLVRHFVQRSRQHGPAAPGREVARADRRSA